MQESRTDLSRDMDVIRSIAHKKVCIRTFGCTYNEGDSLKLAVVLERQGCTFVKESGEADVVIVNTCTVTGATERKVQRELQRLRHCRLYVTGCMAVVQRDAILQACDPAIIQPRAIQSLYRGGGYTLQGKVGIVQACRGCMGACSYCITRRARGPLTSAGSEEILREVRSLVQKGAVEIRLTGQDVSAWGSDIGSNLGALLTEINDVGGNFRVRVGMMNPATLFPIRKEVARAYAGTRIFSFIHLPVQSGSEAVLESMNRGYSCAQVLEIVEKFRSHCPEISVHTDVICGYPGETEEDFRKTLAFLSRMQPDKVNVTRYSPRPGTPAAREHDMPDRIKKERSRALRVHAEGIARARNAAWLSKTVPVLFTEHPRPGSSMGRTPYYQGVVVKGDLLPGTERMVRLIEDRVYYFLGDPA